jgi:hypothetical protein
MREHAKSPGDILPGDSQPSVGSGFLGPTGDFSFNTTMHPAKRQQFFIVQVP